MQVENGMKSLNLASAKGSARTGAGSFVATIAAGVTIALLAGCGGGGGGGGGSTPTQPASSVVLSGTVTRSGKPLVGRYISVQGSSPLNATTTDSNGHYSLTVLPDQTITLEVQDAPAGGCTQTQMPADYTQSVGVLGNASQTADIPIPSTNPPPPPPICS
jgi:hypothetical protein